MVRQSEHRDTATPSSPSALGTAQPKLKPETNSKTKKLQTLSLGAARQDLKFLPRNIQIRDKQAHWKC